ncbi:MAG TPA: sugar phosphate isomerase/epimerase [SAR324 cluster bacterium]|jgi:sugar phosphate isomerase/epimerase|nr:sugar phosphate isomerase/epimerase [SAR324 cluster bacterium]MDP6639153.1 sugar phosphate isomerase/epimerase [SAR324 cluster bacterium]MDP7501945.1 sugar phosphate isomerase/epimerase [SAR324 cluster bacterium]HJM05407.1 sugar phosphate isomerase/epimerase [SAR324 cluster bacterium]
MKEWSFQLYSARKFPPLRESLRLIADLGYSQVEGFGSLYNDTDNLKTMLDDAGITMPTGHFDLAMLQNSIEGFQVAEKLGVEVIVCPYLKKDDRPKDSEGWKRFSQTLTDIGDRCRKMGFKFAWHNHDFEFVPMPDGQIPMKIMLDNSDMDWEMDLAWVVRGNSNPEDWIVEYGNRLCAVHFKDLAVDGENTDEDGWADVGHGVIDWHLMNQLLEKTPVSWFIMEHDNPNDLVRFARRSIETVRELERGK